MYDPNNPNPSVPDGTFAITSAPTQGGPSMGRPGNPSNGMPSPGSPPMGMPGPGRPQGSLPMNRPPQANSVRGMGNPGMGMGMMPDRDGMRSFIEAYRNSIFDWLQNRPQDRMGMQDWRATKPGFDKSALMAAMFPAPPQPAPAPQGALAPQGAPVDPYTTPAPPVF